MGEKQAYMNTEHHRRPGHEASRAAQAVVYGKILLVARNHPKLFKPHQHTCSPCGLLGYDYGTIPTYIEDFWNA